MNYQRFAFAKITQSITGPIHKSWNKFTHNFKLNAENKQLTILNLRLLNERKSNFVFCDDSTYTNEKISFDTVVKVEKRKKLYDYTSANVIFNTTNKKHNYLIIDKGEQEGIYPDMAVLSPLGVVGVVSEVSDHFSTVISLLHPSSRISAKIMPINQIGTVVWDDNNPRTGYLIDIPQHLKINIGDSVFTSGFSNVFPADILIGTVIEKRDNSKNTFLTIKIKFATQFNNVNTVFLVNNIYKDEIDKLKSNFENE